MTVSKIDLRIHQDWNPLIEKCDRIKNVLKNFSEEKAIRGGKNYGSLRYDFGESGSFMFFDDITTEKRTAGAMSGILVESFLPWINRLKEDLSDLNLVSVAFQFNAGNLRRHADANDDCVKECKVNYIIDDYTDKTYTDDLHGTVSNYPSVKNSAWLIDTSKYHWVTNNTKTRYIFQLAFHQDYDEVAEWFVRKGRLEYE